jgi:hypothetical protein
VIIERKIDQQKEAEEAEDKTVAETPPLLTRCEELGFDSRFKRLNLCCLRFLLFEIIPVSRVMGEWRELGLRESAGNEAADEPSRPPLVIGANDSARGMPGAR